MKPSNTCLLIISIIHKLEYKFYLYKYEQVIHNTIFNKIILIKTSERTEIAFSNEKERLRHTYKLHFQYIIPNIHEWVLFLLGNHSWPLRDVCL